MNFTTPLTGNAATRKISYGQNFHASMLDAVPSMIAYIDNNCNYAYVNTAYAKFLGVNAEEVIGKNVRDILGEDIHKQIKNEINEALKGNQVSFEKEVNKDGRKYLEVKYFPDFDENGKVKGFTSVVNDITKVNEAEEALKRSDTLRNDYLEKIHESENRLQQIVEGFPIAFYTCDAEGRITFFNKAAVNLWGREPELNKDLWCGSWKIFKTDGSEVPLDACPMGIALKEGRAVLGEEIIVERPDGKRCNVTPHPMPIFNSAGEVSGAFNALVDISRYKLYERELLQAKQELEKSSEQLEMILEAIPQMAWTSDTNGNLTYFNRVWGDFMHLDDLKEVKNFGHVHNEDKERSIELWKNSIKNGKTFETEYRWKRNDGQYRWMLGRANPVKNAKGIIAFWVGTATDIHEQKSSNELKDEFIGIASHELKTPLTSLKAYIQLIERSLENHADPVPLQYIRKANNYITNLHELIGDLLDVSKIQAGKLSLNNTVLDFDEFINLSIEGIRHTISSHKISIEGESRLKITGDRHRLEQVLTNYISNAVKYSPSANKVSIKITSEGKFAKIAITDFGIGVPKDKLPKLFERFYRVENKSNKFEGLGLGLYICHDIIKQHGGETWAESEPGKGSTFYFTVPSFSEAL